MNYFLIVTTLISSKIFVDASTTCQQGMKDGRDKPEALWTDVYGSDCSLVRSWEADVDEMFNGGQGSDEKTYNQCAKTEADKVVDEKVAKCLTPEQCAKEGQNAAGVIMAMFTAPYCTVIGAEDYQTKSSQKIEKKCKKYAIQSCESYMPQAYQDVLDISECTDKLPELDWDTLEDLQKKCKKTVEDLIEP